MSVDENTNGRPQVKKEVVSDQGHQEKEQKNGVKTYAIIITVVSLLVAAYIYTAGIPIVALYIAIGGVTASSLFCALCTIVDRLNKIIDLLSK